MYAVMRWPRVQETVQPVIPWAAVLVFPAAACLAEPGDLILGPSCWEEQTVWLRRSKKKLVGAVVGCICDGCHRRSPAVGPGVRPPLQKRRAENGQSVLG